MLTYRATTTASPATAWALLARPARWHEWAPHVRGAWGLGRPEVELGARGAVRLLGAVPVPARVTDKQDGASWTWVVGPVEMVHRVRAVRGGAEVAIDISAPRPIESALAMTYGPLVGALVRRLAAVAAAGGSAALGDRA